jgi:hypothetical protein
MSAFMWEPYETKVETELHVAKKRCIIYNGTTRRRVAYFTSSEIGEVGPQNWQNVMATSWHDTQHPSSLTYNKSITIIMMSSLRLHAESTQLGPTES